MNVTFTKLVAGAIIANSVTIQPTLVDYIQGYTVSSNYTGTPIGRSKGTVDPSQCLRECSANPKCQAIALTFPSGFDASHQGGGVNSTCDWYSENIPFIDLVGPMNSPYYASGGEWVAVLNLRANDSTPSVEGLPVSVGTCDVKSGGCFFTCAAGSTSALSVTGSQCEKCKSGTWAGDQNELGSCEPCSATTCNPMTGVAIEPQTSCNSGYGLYDGKCKRCPLKTWSADGIDSGCNYCNGYECDDTGTVTRCRSNIRTCDAAGNANSCAQNYYLDGSNGCSHCDFNSTSPDNNTFTYSSCSQVAHIVVELFPTTVRTIPFSDGTYSGDSQSGNSTSCYAGSELIIAQTGSKQRCMPCEENMQQSVDGAVVKCSACALGTDTCTSRGIALSCSSDWVLQGGKQAICVRCSGLTTSSAGNKEIQCRPAIEATVCSAGLTLNNRGICIQCPRGQSSPGGLVNECQSCGLGAKNCVISAVGVITISACMSSYTFNKTANSCEPIYCGLGLFLLDGVCTACQGATTAPDHNRLPTCLLCSVGASSCSGPQTANTCGSGYKLSEGKCFAQNSYDFIQGYQANLKSGNRLANNQTLTPQDCLALCDSNSFCRAISVKTNGPTLPGVCNLFSDVIARWQMITIAGVQPYTNTKNVSGAPYYAVLNRRNRKSDKPSIENLPATAGSCLAGSRGCFTGACGIGSTPQGNLPAGNCIPCVGKDAKFIPAQNTLLQCPETTSRLMKRTQCS